MKLTIAKSNYCVGIIGGLTYSATKRYTDEINHAVNQRLGGANYPNLLVDQGNYAEYLDLVQQKQWDELRTSLSVRTKRLVDNGADAIVVPSLTLHDVIDEADVVAYPTPIMRMTSVMPYTLASHKRLGMIGLSSAIGTGIIQETMQRRGLEFVSPKDTIQDKIDRTFSGHLCRGEMPSSLKNLFYNAVVHLHTEYDVDGIVLAGAEIGLVLDEKLQSQFLTEALGHGTDKPIKKDFKFYDIATPHIDAVVEFCCANTTPSLAAKTK